MATKGFTKQDAEGRTYRHTWVLTDGDDGDPVTFPGASDRSVQVFGTFGGATIIIEGSNEASPTTYGVLSENDGTALSITSAGVFSVAENVTHIRPRVSGGSSVSVTVIMLSKGTT